MIAKESITALKLTVIVPTYNEAENLPKLVSALLLVPPVSSIIVVDDNSPDGTGIIADRLAHQNPGRLLVVHRLRKSGLRSAYLDGFQVALESGADAIAQMDADLSHDPLVLPEMMAKLTTADVVLGSRYVFGGKVDNNWAVWRKALSAWANYYVRSILSLPLKDVTTGYRLWKADAIRGLPLERVQANGYVFLVEMAYLAHCLEYRFAEVPISFSKRHSGRSKMTFKIQAEAAFRVWQVRRTYKDLKLLGKSARVQF